MRGSLRAPKLRRRRKMQVEVLEDRRLLATITVNTTADDATADATLSLREAIEISDGMLAVSSLSTQEQAQVSGAVGATNTIGFNIPTTDPGYNAATGVWTIAAHSALPTIGTNAAIINGYSQPGASENTLAQGDNAKLKIAISGTGLGTAVGLTIGQPGSQVSGLDIENFGYSGIVVTAAGNAQVAGCFIGTDPTGEAAAPNVTGLVIENSSNLIGGPNLGDRNVISGNSGYGLLIPDQSGNPLNIEPTSNLIENNFIGIDAAGTKALGNAASGIYDSGSGNTYGGTTAGLGNVISGNQEGGLKSGGNITIEGNFIGTDATGNAALGNGGFGGITAGQDVGGAPVTSMTITDNVISANHSGGIDVSVGSQPSLATYLIANNMIGTNAAGTAALGNGATGLQLESVENTTVLNNVISANTVGLELSGFGPDVEHNVIQGNWIGTDKTGQAALGNTQGGMVLSNAIGNTIGGTGTGQGNVIAFNAGNGIYVNGGNQDLITRNSIFGNASAGIKLFPLSTNQLATPPALTFTPGAGGSGTLSGTLTASANLAYTIEIYSNPSAPVAGQEQGQTFIRDDTVNTDSSGKGSFSVTEPTGFYTATATDPSGDTSAFSTVAGSQALAASVTAVSSSANPSTVGQQVTFTAVVTASGFQGTPTGTMTFTIDGQAQTPVALAVVGGMDEARFLTLTLAAGAHSVTAAYSGNANVSGSSGSLPTQTVNAPNLLPTTTSLVSSLNPSTVGQQVTFTAVVSPGTSPGTPTGTVTFTIDGTTEPPVPLQVVNGKDQATFPISTLTAGTHTINATYSGDSTFAASLVPKPLTQTVNALTQTNNPLATSTTVASSTNPTDVGETVTFTATVAPTGTSGTPTGTVTFTIDGMIEPPVSLKVVNGRDQAAFSIATLTAGTHTIGATYHGDATFGGSTVTHPLTQTVIPLTSSSTSSVTPSTTDPPVVVSLKRTGIHMQPTVLVLTFSAALDPIRAQDVRNYRITDPAGRSIGIDSAVYDPTAQTVTLRPRPRIDLHHTYHVTVIGTGSGGVADVRDNLLDGAGNGNAGSDYVTTLNWRNVVLTPAEARRWLPAKHAIPSRVPGFRLASRPG